MKEYGLFRGPVPQQLRTMEEVLVQEGWDEFLRKHFKVEPPIFVGRMPVRQDLPIEPAPDAEPGFLHSWGKAVISLVAP